MKSVTIILVMFLFFTLFLAGDLRTRQALATEEENHCWGLIVQGYGGPTDYVFEGDSQYMHHLMSKHYMFDEICYLAIDTTLPGVTNKTSRENVSWAITEWLHQRSDANDMIFIFFATHGIGHNHSLAIFDTDGDEGDEVRESTIGRDVNGDVTHQWVGFVGPTLQDLAVGRIIGGNITDMTKMVERYLNYKPEHTGDKALLSMAPRGSTVANRYRTCCQRRPDLMC